MLTTVPFLASTDEPSDEKPPWLKYGRMHSGRTKRHGKSSLPSAFRAGKPRGAHNLEDVQEYVSTAVELRSEVNIELNLPPNFEGLVLGCIDADFCK